MKSVLKYLKKLSEEKLIAKEDDGGAAIGASDGGAVVAGDAASDSSDVISGGEQQSPSKTPGLVSTDILGKCDHRKDGVFGPGCFHLPSCVWSIPSYRYPRKKKRKLKYSTFVTEDSDFDLFRQDAEKTIEDEMDAARRYVQNIDEDISLEYEKDYPFEGERADWIACLDKSSQDDVKSFRIGFNIKALYDFLFDVGLEMDELELTLQIRVSLWHELAHALVQYFEDMEIYDFELTEIEEEKLCEEFGKYAIKKYSGVYDSKLNDFIQDTFFEKKPEEVKEDQVGETKGTVLTDFTKPINLAAIGRRLGAKDEQLKGKNFVIDDI